MSFCFHPPTGLDLDASRGWETQLFDRQNIARAQRSELVSLTAGCNDFRAKQRGGGRIFIVRITER